MYLLALLTLGLISVSVGFQTAPLMFRAGINEYPGMAQVQYEGMTIWIPSKPTQQRLEKMV